mgnify:CR=1 FL=1
MTQEQKALEYHKETGTQLQHESTGLLTWPYERRNPLMYEPEQYPSLHRYWCRGGGACLPVALLP